MYSVLNTLSEYTRSRGFDSAQYCVLLDIWWNMLIKFSKERGKIVLQK